MGNKVRGAVTLEALGQTWRLKFSTNAICELEDLLDEPLQVTADKMNNPKTAKITTLRAVLWAGLIDHHDGVTIKEAGAVMDEAGAALVGEKIGEAFQIAFPQVEGKANPPKATAG